MANTFVFICVLCFVSKIEGKRNWQVVPDHPDTPHPIDLADPMGPEVRVTYNDEKARITAIHDSYKNACFLTDYDPGWYLSEDDKTKVTQSRVTFIQRIGDTTENPPYKVKFTIQSLCLMQSDISKNSNTIRSPIEFLGFKQKVGDVISSMCKRRRLFWMMKPRVPPRPQINHVPENQPPRRPPPLHPQMHHSPLGRDQPLRHPPHPPRPHSLMHEMVPNPQSHHMQNDRPPHKLFPHKLAAPVPEKVAVPVPPKKLDG